MAVTTASQPLMRVRAPALRPGALVAAASLGLAALTLLAPSAPTYDPWAWILWGREVLHLDLSTSFGPSWKPLPVAITTVAALCGSAAPALWLLVARAGALAGVYFAFRLTRRLTGSAWPALAAAAVLLVAPWFTRNAVLGNSEGMQVAFALAALDQGVAGRPRRAFLLAIGLCLLRPEAWPFAGLYGAWLVWRERDALKLVALGLLSLPLLWFVPERLGSGDWMRASHRAQDAVSAAVAHAAHPFADVVRSGWDLLGQPLQILFVAAIAAAVVRRDRRLLALAGLAAAWTLLVAGMTAHGYSGNPRYLIVPAAVAIVVAIAGVWPLVCRVPVLAAVIAAMAIVPWLAPTDTALQAGAWQARMTHQLGRVVGEAGGATAVKRCGPVSTDAYLVPAVAWRLGLRIDQIGLVADRPGTVLRVHVVNDGVALPTLTPLAGAPTRTLAASRDWRILSTCL